MTILLSSDKPGEKTESEGKSKPAVSKRAKRGGAAAAPRAKRVAGKTEASVSGESGDQPAKGAAAKGEKKTGKVASKLGKALRRKKSED